MPNDDAPDRSRTCSQCGADSGPDATVCWTCAAPFEIAWSALRVAAPPGAEVRIDGIFAGSGDLEVTSIANGRHVIEVVLAGHETWTVTVDVPAVDAVFPSLEALPPPPEPEPQAEGQLPPAAVVEAASATSMIAMTDLAGRDRTLDLSPDPIAAADERAPSYELRDWFDVNPPRTLAAHRRQAGGRRAAWMAAALIIAAIGFGSAATYLFVSRGNAGASGPDQTPVATSTTAASPTIAPSPTTAPQPTVVPTPLPATSAVVAGVEPDVCAYQRTEPRIGTNTVVQCIPNHARVALGGNVQFSEGKLWWHTSYQGRSGWMANDFIQPSALTIPVNVSDTATATLTFTEVDVQPDGTLIVRLSFHNPTPRDVAWTPDTPGQQDIYLTDATGRALLASGVGGSFGRALPGGVLRPGATEHGWLRFDSSGGQSGSLTLHYPGHRAITFTLP